MTKLHAVDPKKRQRMFKSNGLREYIERVNMGMSSLRKPRKLKKKWRLKSEEREIVNQLIFRNAKEPSSRRYQ